jgi:hypothetical protein
MDEIFDNLLNKLSKKGLTLVEIELLLEDVLHIVGDGGEFTVSSINRRLAKLGWDEAVLDNFTFELIIAALRNEGEYEIKRTTIH